MPPQPAWVSESGRSAAEKARSRPHPPPEMSLLTPILIDTCAELDQPSLVDEASAADAFDRTERQDASPAQVVRTADRMGKGIRTVLGLPNRRGKYVFCDKEMAEGLNTKPVKNMKQVKTTKPVGKSEPSRSQKSDFDFDSDPNRIIISNAQKMFEDAAKPQFAAMGSATDEDRIIFGRLVKEEERLELLSGSPPAEKDKLQKKCWARAVLGLLQLLASVLWYLIWYPSHVFMWNLALTYFFSVIFPFSKSMVPRGEMAPNRDCNAKRAGGGYHSKHI